MAGEVSEDKVMFIVTRTNAPTHERFVKVVEEYYKNGNPYSRNSHRYELGYYDKDEVMALGDRLWYSGRIHQPRMFIESTPVDLGMNLTPGSHFTDLWVEVAPAYTGRNTAVLDAYNKYKMLLTLTK
jgi:hypothetical protein